MMASDFQKKVQQGTDRDKPTVHLADSFQEELEPQVNLAIFEKAACQWDRRSLYRRTRNLRLK